MAKSKYTDPGGRHIRVYCTLLDTPAYRVLSFSAKALFVDMRAKLTATNNGNLSATLSDMKHRGWTSPATLSKALYELRTMGFIALTRGGGLKQATRICSLYRFTDVDVFELPKFSIQAIKATHDYLSFKSVAEAERALREGITALKDEGKKKQASIKNLPVHISYRVDTENVLKSHSLAT